MSKPAPKNTARGVGSSGGGSGGTVRPQRPQRPQRPAKPKPHQQKAKKPAPVAKAKGAPAPKTKRGLALHDEIACCAAEALAVVLRLGGHPVTDTDVAELYFYTARSSGQGADIADTLDAAARRGLAGARPVFEPGDDGLVILGVDLPEGPHTVLDDGTGWWSWGRHWPYGAFPEAVAEEAWSVTAWRVS